MALELHCDLGGDMPSTSNTNHRWAVVLAGGDGTRLQELTYRVSGDTRPKQFCHFFGGKSLLGHTRERIGPLFHDEQTLFVLARAHEAYYRQELSMVPARNTIIQSANRGTAVALALCLHAIAQQDEDALVSFFPSDHYYSSCSAFRESVESGLRQIEEYPDCILIVGAEARYAEAEYGWIQSGRTLVDSLVNPLLRVTRFWEKPAPKRAEALQRRGCLWNTFITIGLVGTFIELLHATLPELTRLLEHNFMNGRIDQFYGQIAPVDFSRTVLTQKPERLVVLRDAASGWIDFGSPRRVIDVLLSQGIRPSWLDSQRVETMKAFHNGVGVAAKL
jgi:mannose-1-phosphate guanylyltransferase